MLEEKGEVVDMQGEEQRCARHMEGEEGERMEGGVERAQARNRETETDPWHSGREDWVKWLVNENKMRREAQKQK